MQIALFIPCYIDQFFPHVGMATVETLERLVPPDQLELVFPAAQTCCGQPMANTGVVAATEPLAHRFYAIFHPYQYVVCPSGSCTAMVRHHYEEYFQGRPEYENYCLLRDRTYELTEFLTDVLGVTRLSGKFPYRVGLHQSCHGLRELRLAKSSEIVGSEFSKINGLLESLDGLELAQLQRPDECCGFGGTFAVHEEAVSCMMGQDRLADHLQAGTQVLTASDMSCLMHLDGLIRRQRLPMAVMHLAEILAGHQPRIPSQPADLLS